MSSVYCAIIRCRASEAENVDFIGSVPLIYIGFSCLDPAVLTIYVSLPITLEVFAFLMQASSLPHPHTLFSALRP